MHWVNGFDGYAKPDAFRGKGMPKIMEMPVQSDFFADPFESVFYRRLGQISPQVIFEYEHGDAKTKKQLQVLLDIAKEGDTIITLEVSRLSRSTQQLCELIEIIRAKHLRLVIVGSITIDCRNGQTDHMSEAFLQMAGVFSQLELAMIRARVKSGMENAKAKGKRVGRRPTTKDDIPAIFHKHYAAFRDGKMNVSELARVCGISRPTVYKYLKLIV